TLGGLISFIVNRSERGHFHLGGVHYPYVGGLLSLLFNSPARVYGTDFQLYDSDGNIVIKAAGVETDAYMRELVLSLIDVPLSGGKLFLQLHFKNAYIPRGFAVITNTQSTFAEASKGRLVNIVSAFTARKPSKGPGGNLRIHVDSIRLGDIDFALGFPGP